MNELNMAFNEYIDKFKQLDINSKRDEFIKSLKEFLAVIIVLASNEGIQTSFLKNNEILDLQKEYVSEDDFLEAAMVYLENAKNTIGEFLEKKLYNDILE